MIAIQNLKKFFRHHTMSKGRILEVNVKQYYIIEGYESMSDEEIKEEWFVKFKGQSHAYRDGSLIHGADHLISAHSLSIEEINKLPD